jgi:hypothetical protein
MSMTIEGARAGQRDTEPFSSLGLAGLKDVDDFGQLPGGLHHAASRHAGPGSTHAQAPKIRIKSPLNPRCQGTAQVPVHCGLAFTT